MKGDCYGYLQKDLGHDGYGRANYYQRSNRTNHWGGALGAGAIIPAEAKLIW